MYEVQQSASIKVYYDIGNKYKLNSGFEIVHTSTDNVLCSFMCFHVAPEISRSAE